MTALDNKLFTIAIFLDFSKAFDTVNKDIMIRKLDRLGFRNNIGNFFDSYLSNRKMYVSVNGFDSTIRTTNIGLPQGSVSSPWLFSMYINDMHRTSDKFKFIHFADDTTIYMTGRDLTKLFEEVCEELCLIDDWLMANRLSLNVDKTYFMVMTHNDFNIGDYSVKIRDKSIKYVKSTKFLGITIDDRFNYNDHFSLNIRHLSRVKRILLKLSNFVPAYTLRKIYYALFYSRMTYGIAVWGGAGDTNVGKLRRLNRSTIGIFVNNLNPNILSPLQYDQVYLLVCLIKFHSYKINNFFFHFHYKIANLIPVHNHDTRFLADHCLTLPITSKTVTQNQFLFNATKLWNNLPQDLKILQTSVTFKSKIKLYLNALFS